MKINFLNIITLFLFIVLPNQLIAEETLTLSVKEGSHSVGYDQNTLGINAYNKNDFNQALTHFQVASVVDKKKGEIFFNIGLTLHRMEKHLESAKNFQWALKLSSSNKKIFHSLLVKEHHCSSDNKIPCNLPKPEKYKIKNYTKTLPQPNISSSSGGGY
jgi:tetratricopeptide (TPR) repeat protein